MKQTDLSLDPTIKRARKREFARGWRGAMGGAGRVGLALCPRRQEGAFALFGGVDAVHSLLHVWTRRLLQALLNDGQRSAHMYTACLVGNTSACPQPR